MKNRRDNRSRKNRVFALTLALALCLALLWGGVGALGQEGEVPQENQEGGGEIPQQGGEVTAPVANEPEPEPVQTPSYTITWVDGNGNTLETDTVQQGDTPSYSGATPTKNQDAQYTYTFANDWDPAVAVANGNQTYTAKFTGTLRAYTVTWKNGDTVIETDENVSYGTTPTYDSEPPTKAPDAQYTYTFAEAWEPAVQSVMGDATYVAKFNTTINSYTITWQNEDGSTIDTTTVAYGQTPTHAEPTKDETDDAKYVFAGWDPAVAAVEGEATYKATFTTKTKHTITWDKANGTSVETTKVADGDIPAYPGENNPTKAETAEFTYTFAGWSPAIVAANANATYTATYTQAKRQYPVTWKNADGTVLETDTAVEYGATPTYDSETPVKAADDNYIYTFSGWTPEVAAITAETTYTATYTQEERNKTSAPYTYRISPDKKEAFITGYSGTEPNLVVPETIDNLVVTGIGNEVFGGREELISVTIPSKVRTIGASAFAGCPNLASVTLPDSLEGIGENLFLNDPALTTLVLRCTQNTTLNPSTTINHNTAGADGNLPPAVTLPMAVTDIVVTKNGDPANVPALTTGDFTVQPGHSITVEAEATLTNNGTINNLGTITNAGTFTNNGSVYACAGTVNGTITGGVYVAPGNHNYSNGACTYCGQALPKLVVKFKGGTISKVYDRGTMYYPSEGKNFINKFYIEDTYGLDVKITGFQQVQVKGKSGTYDRIQFDAENAGKHTVKAYLTLGGDDAELYGKKITVSLSGKIELKPLIIKPKAGQKKTYGAADPKSYKGTVTGLLKGDEITGNISREFGENVGKYRFTKGNFDPGPNYDVQVTEVYFEITPKSINASDVGLVTIGSQRYTGKAVEPDITLRYGKNTLKKDTDFKVEYKDNVQPGVATVKLTGIGNYNGSRETTFRILNIASGVSTGSSSSGGGGYSYGGFDDGEGDSDEDEYEDESEEQDVDLGKLIVKGEDYGTILFNAEGEPAPFVQFEEEIEQLQEGELTGDPVEPTPWTLTIIADPLENEETGETLMLDGDEREEYDELHLRLPTTLVRTLVEKGCTDIIYELGEAELHVPLASLVSEFEREDASAVEVVDAEDETIEEVADDEEVVEEAAEEVEVELVPTTVHVALYDICVEQSEVAVLTEREVNALNEYDDVTPAYRLIVRAELESEDGETLELANDGGTVNLAEAQRLPDYGWPVNLTLRLTPNEEMQAPEETETDDEAKDTEADDGEPKPITYPDIYALYVSTIEDETVDPDLVTLVPAPFVDVDGSYCAELPAVGDGLYAVVRPAEAGAEDDEDEGLEFEDMGGGSVSSGLSTIGSSFTLDENGNPVMD